MPRFKAFVQIPRVRPDALQLILQEAYRTMVEAAREFVRKSYGHVPVDTGMARASIRKIGTLVNVIVPIQPKRKRKDKSITLGDMKTTTDLIISGKSIIFVWYPDIPHYLENEFGGYGPWQSQKIGLEAMNRVLKAQLPNIGKAFKIISIE